MFVVNETKDIDTMDTLFLMRVGEKRGNFKVSVLDRMMDSNKQPIWGYNKHKRQTVDKLLREKTAQGGAYVFFLPSGPDGICGLGKVSVADRNIGPLISIDETNEEIGWTTSATDGGWDVEVRLSEYWDLSNFKQSVFSLQALKSKQFLGPNSLHRLSEGCMTQLYNYLHPHAEYIVSNLQSSFSYSTTGANNPAQDPLLM